MRPFRPMVQKHKLKGDFNLLIDSTHISLLVSRKPLLILILTSTFLAQNITIISSKKKNKKKIDVSDTNPQARYCCLKWFSVAFSVYALSCNQACTLFVYKVPVYYMFSTLWDLSQTLCTQKVPKMCSWNRILVREHCSNRTVALAWPPAFYMNRCEKTQLCVQVYFSHGD